MRQIYMLLTGLFTLHFCALRITFILLCAKLRIAKCTDKQLLSYSRLVTISDEYTTLLSFVHEIRHISSNARILKTDTLTTVFTLRTF